MPSRWQWGSTPDKLRAAVDAAEKLFVERGYSNVTIDDISAASGLSTGSLYHHFESPKENLFQIMLDRHVKRMADEIDMDELPGSYLRAVWVNRALILALGHGDGPADFSARQFGMEGLRAVFPGEGVVHRLVLGVIAEATYVAAECESIDEVNELVPMVSTAMRLVSALTPGSHYGSVN